MIAISGGDYYEFVKEMWYEGISKPEMYINTDTYFMKDTFTSAFAAARTVLLAARSLSDVP